MVSQIYTYTLIRCLYNKGDDYIDSFYPLVVNILPLDKTPVSLEEIQINIRQKFKLNVPLHSLSAIAARAKLNGLIERKKRHCSLTEEGVVFVSALESERDEARRINEFITEAKKYIKVEHNLDMTIEQVEVVIEKVIRDNLEIMEPFLDSTIDSTQSAPAIANVHESAAIDFLFHVERAKPLLFHTLQDIIIGGIISHIVYTDNFVDTDKKIEKIKVFLDSNFMFSLLGLGFAEENQPAKELYDLLIAQPNIELRIFDFTVDEMIGVLKSYQQEQYRYPAGIRINSIYSSLKVLGWTSADVKEFIVNVERKLADMGIRFFSTQIDLEKYEPSPLDRISQIAKYKHNQPPKGQNHDLAAIDQIKSFRKGIKKKFENCEAIFLTRDLKLSKFNFNEDAHKANETISEVFPDKLLTNLLWLKNPTHDEEIHLSSWISLNTRHFYIDRSVWMQFYENLKRLREQKKIDDTDISILIYDKHIQQILRDTDPSDIQNIEAEWIFEGIEKSKERLQNTQDKEINKLEQFFEEEIKKKANKVEFLATESKKTEELLESAKAESENKLLELSRRIKELEQENKDKDERIIDSIIRWKKRKEIKSEKMANRILDLILYTSAILIFFILLLISKPILDHWDMVEPIAWVVSIGAALIYKILGNKYDPFNYQSRIYDYFFTIIHARNLRDIEEIEPKIEIGVEIDG